MEARPSGKGSEAQQTPTGPTWAGGRGATSAQDRRWLLFGATALIAGIALRLQLATAWQTPGHGDSAFYYTVARNIVDGRGLVVDYVVYFFDGLVPITHYAADFWNPLAEILLSFPMLLLGKSVFNALLATIAAGIVPALVGYFAAQRVLDSTPWAVLAGALTFFAPYQVWVSTLTEAIIFFGAFGSLALLFAIKGLERPRLFLIAALCTGLAHLVRQDGILLLGAGLVSIAFAAGSVRKRLGVAAGVLAIHVLVVSPLAIRNYVTFGSPMPPGPASTMFMTSYEDFHSYGKTLDWASLRASWGIRGIIKRRLHTAGENLGQLEYFLSPVFAVLFSLGLVDWLSIHRNPRALRRLLPPALFALFAYLFSTFVAAFSGPGTLPKSLAILLPFVCIVIVGFLSTYIKPQLVLATAVVGLCAYGGWAGYSANYRAAIYYNQAYENYAVVRSLVEDDARKLGIADADIVVMARDVWDVYAATGFRSVMIPNNDLATILNIARHYRARYMLLPAPRPALEDIYLGTTPDPHFHYLGSVPGTDWSVFRLILNAN